MRSSDSPFRIAALVAALLAACGSGGEEGAAPAKAEPAKAEPAKAEPAKAEPAKAEPRKPSVPVVPGDLVGVWEKAEMADRGLRVEFKADGDAYAAAVAAPPVVDQAAIDSFSLRLKGDKARGERSARCAADSWKPGEAKFTGLVADGEASWTADEVLHAYFVDACLMLSPKVRKVRLFLDAPDRLLVSPVEAAAGKSPQPNVWRKVPVVK